jgi:Protein of unknown function (DUF1239).
MRRLNQRVAKESLARRRPRVRLPASKALRIFHCRSATKPKGLCCRISTPKDICGENSKRERPRIDQEHVAFQQLKIYNLHTGGSAGLRIDMSTSVLDLKTRILSSKARTTIQRADFNIAGDSVEFDTNSKTGRLIGNVKMVITDKSHLTATPSPKE